MAKGEGSIKNVGDFKSPFDVAKSPSTPSKDSAYGMRGPSTTTDQVFTVQVPPSSGGSGEVQNVGKLDPGAKAIK